MEIVENECHIKNNSYESYNAQFNKLFDKNKKFNKLLYELKLEENNTYKKEFQVYYLIITEEH